MGCEGGWVGQGGGLGLPGLPSHVARLCSTAQEQRPLDYHFCFLLFNNSD